jgi:S-adenosylmethionine:tRNA ribosyltransferase-isomerase
MQFGNARGNLPARGNPAFRYSEGWMDLTRFDYQLPEELIAQAPLADRAASRMLVLYRREGRWEDRAFREFPEFLAEGDCLVLNDSRVFPARLFGHRMGVRALPIGKKNPARREYLTGEVEVFLLRAVSADGRDWEALVRPGRKMRKGERVRFADGLEAEIVAQGEFGERVVRFAGDADLFTEFEKIGHVPLPPYIKRPDETADRERYQTVFARERGSVAAPTAGLHFTGEILDGCRARGAAVAYVTLHVGLGTFQPLRAEQVEQARLHSEWYHIDEENAAHMRAAKRLVAVGTTSVRSIESALRGGEMRAVSGETDIFLYPGCRFAGVGAMLTNFHLPRTSLLLLVCAFAGTELALAAYRHAVEERYRFYSYGDCMLVV